MNTYLIDNDESYSELYESLKDSCLLDKDKLVDKNNNTVLCSLEFNQQYQDKLSIDDIIYGKNKETNIVNITVDRDKVYIFKELDGKVIKSVYDYKHWVLSSTQLAPDFKRLSGNQTFKFIKDYDVDAFEDIKKNLYKVKSYTVHNKPENFMIKNGYTYFKGMKVNEVSLLSFDIETSGLSSNAKDAKVFLITNTFRKKDTLISRVFNVDDYANDGEMIKQWCKWVVNLDPSILLGHYIVMFDIGYLNARYQHYFNESMPLGRDCVNIEIEDRPRELRKDGSQSYSYHRVNVFGREVVDTFFLAIKADIARKYESYGLKSIIKQEGLEEKDRQHYDAGSIKDNWHIPEEKAKIIAYAENDSRDSIKLYDLMISTFFYICPVIPKSLQSIIESATGSQLNTLMVRSYLQKNGSIPEATQVDSYQGAISFGVPGIYKNVLKIDFSALYPSIMRQYKVHDKNKDPEKNFLKVVEYFAEYRQTYKRKYKETGDKYYDDMQNVAKVIANSCYGFLGASGLHFNSPTNAAFITAKARELLTFTIKWATGKEVDYWLNLFEEKTK